MPFVLDWRVRRFSALSEGVHVAHPVPAPAVVAHWDTAWLRSYRVPATVLPKEEEAKLQNSCPLKF